MDGLTHTFSPGLCMMVPLSFFMAPLILSPREGLRFWWWRGACLRRERKRPPRRRVVVVVVVVWWVILVGIVLGGFVFRLWGFGRV